MQSGGSIGVAFVARGTDAGWYTSCERFLGSYRRYCPGAEHSLYVILEGFRDARVLDEARDLFSGVRHKPVWVGEDGFHIGACIEWAKRIREDLICVLNTASEILAEDWLRKLAVNLALPNVGLVGATGSYEILENMKESPSFPNPHIRLNAFMIERNVFCRITQGKVILEERDAYQFERGRESLTRQVLAMGREVLVVGRNGRGYAPKWWPTSDTFHQGTQCNLLVADEQTRSFIKLPWFEKREVVVSAWGGYLRNGKLMSKV